MIVLDASALLALLQDERGAERVERALPEACMSTVNLSEVLGRIARHGDPFPVAEHLERSPIEFVAFSTVHALLAAALVPAVSRAGLSLGDRACLALALDRQAPVLTADRAWDGLDVRLDIELIR